MENEVLFYLKLNMNVPMTQARFLLIIGMREKEVKMTMTNAIIFPTAEQKLFHFILLLSSHMVLYIYDLKSDCDPNKGRVRGKSAR